MMNYKAKAKDSYKTKMNLFIYDLAIQNKTEFTLDDFNSYKISTDRVGEYTTVYWQKDRTHPITSQRTIDDIYHAMVDIRNRNEPMIKECEKYYVEHYFPTIFSEEKLKEFDLQDSCGYCGITKKDIQTLREYKGLRKKHERGWNLELDRLDSNFEYKPDNCVMCCYWCNNAKTDEFTATEFKAIGEVMHQIWQERKKLAMDRRYDERFGEPIPFTKVVMRTGKE
jgi:hypothetical protein